RVVVAKDRDALDHDFSRAGRLETAGRQPVSNELLGLVDIQVAVVERDAGASMSLDANERIRYAVVVHVAERDERGRRIAAGVGAKVPELERREHVAVRRDDEMPRIANMVGEDRRAEAAREGEARVRRWTGGDLLGRPRLKANARREAQRDQQVCGKSPHERHSDRLRGGGGGGGETSIRGGKVGGAGNRGGWGNCLLAVMF